MPDDIIIRIDPYGAIGFYIGLLFGSIIGVTIGACLGWVCVKK
jgi:hypothetical protein